MIEKLRKSKARTLDKSRNQPTRQTKQRNQPHGRLQRLDCFDPIARNSPKKSCLFRPIPPGLYPSPRFLSLLFLTFSSPPHPFLCLGCSPLPTFSNGGYINSSSSYGLRVVNWGANRIFFKVESVGLAALVASDSFQSGGRQVWFGLVFLLFGCSIPRPQNKCFPVTYLPFQSLRFFIFKR